MCSSLNDVWPLLPSRHPQTGLQAGTGDPKTDSDLPADSRRAWVRCGFGASLAVRRALPAPRGGTLAPLFLTPVQKVGAFGGKK